MIESETKQVTHNVSFIRQKTGGTNGNALAARSALRAPLCVQHIARSMLQQHTSRSICLGLDLLGSLDESVLARFRIHSSLHLGAGCGLVGGVVVELIDLIG